MASCLPTSSQVVQPTVTSNCLTRHGDDVSTDVTAGVQRRDVRPKFSIEEILKPSFGRCRAPQSGKAAVTDVTPGLDINMDQDDDGDTSSSDANDDEQQHHHVDDTSSSDANGDEQQHHHVDDTSSSDANGDEQQQHLVDDTSSSDANGDEQQHHLVDDTRSSDANSNEQQHHLVGDTSRCSMGNMADEEGAPDRCTPEGNGKVTSPDSFMSKSVYLPYLLNYQLAANYRLGGGHTANYQICGGHTLKENSFQLPYGVHLGDRMHFLNPFGHYLTGLYARYYEHFIINQHQRAKNGSFYNSAEQAKEHAQTQPNEDFELSARRKSISDDVNESRTDQLCNQALNSGWQLLSQVKDVRCSQVEPADPVPVPASGHLRLGDNQTDARGDRRNKNRNTVGGTRCVTPDVQRQTSDISRGASDHASDHTSDHTSGIHSNKSVLSCNSAEIKGDSPGTKSKDPPMTDKNLAQLPAWVFCTRYSDRPSSGPRYRKPRQKTKSDLDKRPRTAFTTQQLQRLRLEFETCPYLCEKRRKHLSAELQLSESQVKIWFQNKRAKLKKRTGRRNSLALRLMEEGLYNHSTIMADDSTDQDSINT